MHMADALVSPLVGGSMWAASACTIAVCSKKVREELDDKKIPLMGVLGAFIFAAQMINFTIPATGSSGHLGGGMMLSILLGPYAAFLTIASVLVVQALFFADGGLLALGCNIINLGIFPAFIAYPFVYRPIAGTRPTRGRITLAALASAIISLQMGALGVVAETTASGISALPLLPFATLMLPIHLGIGIVEGVITATVISFVSKARPEMVLGRQAQEASYGMTRKSVVLTVLAVAILTGGVISRFASEKPDGLEWSIKKITGASEVVENKTGLHGVLAGIQEYVAILPDYSFKKPAKTGAPRSEATGEKEEAKRTGSRLGTSVAGVVGGVLTLTLALLIGFVLKKRSPAPPG